jgi:SAM-dependent methyltransferase
VLRDRCGVTAVARVLEIGPGPGLATARVLATGAHVVAVEPDAALVDHLATRFGPDVALELRTAAFEDIELDDGSFDAAFAATSFHWVEPAIGLTKVRRLLRPGGWWAMWWNVFGDPERPDPFHDATAAVMDALLDSPSVGARGMPFALDRDALITDLAAAGFETIEAERPVRPLTLSTAQVEALYATYSPVRRLEPGRRRAVLAAVAGIAEREFGGQVQIHVLTPIYTARNPGP